MVKPFLRGPIEFDCEGCGVRVVGFGYKSVPVSQMCSTCEFLSTFIADPDEFWRMYQHLHDKGRGPSYSAE